ncbi:hypothetical protein [Sphingobacterium sp. SYP-B4668]|uniref:hypothetical protein n=1 Tax=Sphingobacterium sp. SYP-B4668 TaxID=2996035 RepID=UPI0022DE4F2E|nr:hypothetical protein [Sphingobacterium sp. SYP-B4668]
MTRKKNAKNDTVVHRLSNNSKSTGHDFGYANRISSKVHAMFKHIFKQMPDARCYKRLVKTVISIMNSDYTNPIGKKAMENGNISLLNGFRLNDRRFFESIAGWEPTLHIDVAQKQIEILVPKNTNWEFPNAPQRMSHIVQQFHVVIFENKFDEYIVVQTEPLFLKKSVQRDIRKVKFKLNRLNDCLVIILGRAQYHLYEKQGTMDFASHNRLHFGIDILKAIWIKEDKEVLYVTPQIKTPIFPSREDSQDVKWE